MRTAALALALIVSVTSAAAAAGGRATGPVTLVETEAPIFAFAQDGARIAWIRRVPGGPPYAHHAAVYVRAVVGGSVIRLTPRPELGNTYGLALGGGRALWWAGWESMTSWTVVGTAAVGDRRTARPAGGVHALDGCQGSFVAAVAGDRHRLVYSIIRSAEGEDSTCVDRPGLTARVVGRQARRLPGVPGGWPLAVAGPRLAVAAESGQLEVRSADSGRLVASFRLGGTPIAVALGADYASAIVRTGNSARLEVHNLATGDLRGSVTLRGRAGPDLSAAERRVVYSIGRTIYVLDAGTLKRARVAVAAAPPVGLSIEGRRVAWAENARGRGWVKALVLG